MKKVTIFLAIVLMSTTACIRFGNSEPAAVAGVFKSTDKGETWVAKNTFLYSGGVGNINGVNVIDLAFDPQDYNALYLNSSNSGLLFSYDATDSWRKVDKIVSGTISDIAIDYHDKCTIYATYAHTILKTEDCTRTWEEIYVDARSSNTITVLTTDFFDSNIIYAGTTLGDILKSYDRGEHWQVLNRFGSPIRQLTMDSDDSRLLYAATQGKGIYKSYDSGANWEDINEGLKQYSGAMEFRHLEPIPSVPNGYILVSRYGLLKTEDGGETWERINIISPPTSVEIQAIAVDPEDSNEIFYATNSIFYHTVDGGVNWETKRLPSAASPRHMLIDPRQPHVIYLGFANPEQ